ncbi:MAG: hypothetical protein JWP30_981 [Homoserinimonas sp.]|jgi:hypothetical protein|nr:hypothetical protein [Homoserinimonas sp.]
MTDTEIPIDEPLAARLALAVEAHGEAAVATHAVGLLASRNEGEEMLLYVGGRHAQGVLNGAPPLYWPEVWGARALLHVWDESAASEILRGLHNQAWRVREMCLKVCAVRELGDDETLVPCLTDENPRVRAAAARALAVTGTAVSAEAIKRLLRDPDKDVKRTAEQALKALADRT